MNPTVSTERVKSAADVETHLLRPLAQAWIQRLDSAAREKEPFQKIANQCDKFFTGDTKFMWEQSFRDEFLPGMAAPGIQVTLAKAFELVAIFGPTLFWDYPTRQVKSHRGADPAAITDLLETLGVGPEIEDLIAQDQVRTKTAEVRNSLMQVYLNWAQAQQPGHGLAREGQLCITEALVKGRGCAWTQDYQFPATADTYTGTFYDSVDNLFIDPDCKDPELRTATWIARKHVSPVWEVERMFDLEKDSLREHATKRSSENNSRDNTTAQNSNDLIEWWEIWSKGGVGTLMRESDHSLGEALDETVGDFAYCCVARGVDFFLNATGKQVYRAKPEEIQQLFRWRTANYGSEWEAWRDGQWPVCLLDFYPVPNSAWPLAPMAPGLGELIAMNVLLTSYIEVSWENRKQLIAVAKNAAQAVKDAVMSSKAVEYVEINTSAQQTIDQMVKMLERPPANRDILDALAMLSESFDKRTGLSEILYAMSSRQIRVAADANTRQENASIRPEKMARDVASWMSRIGANEMSMAATFVKGESLVHLLGPVGSKLWDTFVSNPDTTLMMREMMCTVEATEMMRPNRERDLANLQALSQYMLPPYQRYAEMTGDSGPLNGFLQSIGEAMDHDVSEWEMGPWQQQPDPQAQQMAMQAQQAELENTQADTALKQSQAASHMATAQGKQAEPMLKQMEFQFEQQQAMNEMQLRQTEATLDMQQKAREHEMGLMMQVADHDLSTEQRRADHLLGMVNSGTTHEQQLDQKQETHEQQLKHQKDAGKLKLELMKKQAESQPSKPKESKDG